MDNDIVGLGLGFSSSSGVAVTNDSRSISFVQSSNKDQHENTYSIQHEMQQPLSMSTLPLHEYQQYPYNTIYYSSAAGAPPSSSMIVSSSLPPSVCIQQPPPIPNPYQSSSTAMGMQQYSLPTFQPPQGIPPQVASYHPPPIIPIQHNPSTTAPISIPNNVLKKEEHVQNNNDDDPLEKARKIAMRFHQESTNITDSSIPANINYTEQRKEHFQKEDQKLRHFQLKNYQYVMRQEEKELRHSVDCMNQMTAYEERQDLQLQLQKEQYKQRQLQMHQKQQQREQIGMLNEGSCGIGTKEQRKAEHVRKRQHYDSSNTNSNNASTSNKQKTTALRTSIYLSNLTTDGSCTERTLQSLFCLYGRLDRVVMYRNRTNGELKGDGLIVFGRDAAEEYRVKNNDNSIDLVESVCTQVRMDLYLFIFMCLYPFISKASLIC